MNKYGKWMILVLIMAIAVWMRLRQIEKVPFWFDEANVVILGKENSYLDLMLLNHWDVSHPPLYNVFIKWWTSKEASESWSRIPGLVLSIGSLGYWYLILKELIRKIEVRYLMLLLVACSEMFIWLSLFARPYAGIQLFSLGLIYYWIKHDRIGIWLMSWLGVLTDYSFWWLIVSINIMCLVHWIRLRVNGYNLVLVNLPVMFWVLIFATKLPDALRLNSFRCENMSGNLLIDYLVSMWMWMGKWAVGWGVLLAITMVIWLWIHRKKVDQYQYILWWVILSLCTLISLIFSYLVSPIYVYRNVFPCTYGLLMLLGIMLDNLTKYQRLAVSGVLILMLIFSLINIEKDGLEIYSNGLKEAKQEMSDACEQKINLSELNHLLPINKYSPDVKQVMNKYYLLYSRESCYSR